MMVVVNEENIEKYNLVELTGKTRDELLALRDLLTDVGCAYKVMVPDSFNIFDHVESTKSVEHSQPHVLDYPVENHRRDDIRVVITRRDEDIDE